MVMIDNGDDDDDERYDNDCDDRDLAERQPELRMTFKSNAI